MCEVYSVARARHPRYASLMHLGMGELLVVLIVALLVFGPSKLPELGDALGKSIRNFKKAANGGDSGDVAAETIRPGQLTAHVSVDPKISKSESART
ncbi:MAG TPA: twin-arginine translocase TatA/TatE family subunit [Anaeromyxobacteraceae bacterium]|nr:twin-arginine translocase TatA/TatE family subunit [Anaeromyxobacteraceae bacterium]